MVSVLLLWLLCILSMPSSHRVAMLQNIVQIFLDCHCNLRSPCNCLSAMLLLLLHLHAVFTAHGFCAHTLVFHVTLSIDLQLDWRKADFATAVCFSTHSQLAQS